MSEINTDFIIPEEVILKINDLRDLQFFALILNTNAGSTVISDLSLKEKGSLHSALVAYLGRSFKDINERWTQVNHLLSMRSNNLIPNELFNWLHENQDACAATWCYLYTYTNFQIHGQQQTTNLLIDSHPHNIFYHQIGLNKNPSSHTERFNSIKLYFDRLIISTVSVFNKSIFMDNLKSYWFSALKNVKNFNWLEEPEREKCNWGWEYLEKYHREEQSKQRPGINTLATFKPLNEKEKFLAIYGALRCWSGNHSEKILLLKNMSRAWRERQRRQDQTNKKAINVYVDIKVKERLARLARYNRCHVNEVLSDLINKEYRRLEPEIQEQFD